jgi:hypothetical protein
MKMDNSASNLIVFFQQDNKYHMKKNHYFQLEQLVIIFI